MARPRKDTTTDNLERQIKKLQERVIKTKEAHDLAVRALQKMLDKRDAQRKDELWGAIVKSGKSYDEIIRFFRSNPDVDE